MRDPAVLRTRRTDAEGRFQVELPEQGETMLRRWRKPVFQWAFGPGGALALRPIPERWPPDGEPVRLALARPEMIRLHVLDPAWAVTLADGLPDDPPGARMRPKATVRRVIADVLAYEGPERRGHLDSEYLGFEGDSRDSEGW